MQIVPEQILIRIAARSEPHQTGIGYVRESVGPGIGDNLVHKSKRIEVADSLGKVRLQRLIEAKAKRGCSRITVKLWSEPQVRHPGHENVCRPDTLQSGHDPEFVEYSLRNRSTRDEVIRATPHDKQRSRRERSDRRQRTLHLQNHSRQT